MTRPGSYHYPSKYCVNSDKMADRIALTEKKIFDT